VVDLNNAIRRIELRAEQLVLHLRSTYRDTPGAEQIRSMLLVMLVRLVALKGTRDQLEDELDQAA